MGIETVVHINKTLPIFVDSALEFGSVSRIDERDFFIEVFESARVFSQEDFHEFVHVLAQPGVEFVGRLVLRKRMGVPMVEFDGIEHFHKHSNQVSFVFFAFS